MSERQEGYILDVEYPARFHRETTPAWLNAVALALGMRAPSLHGAFSWLELGCGSALGAAVCAAAWPGARFVGIDANPEHVQRGRTLAERAGLKNLAVRQATFLELADAPAEALPACDYIVLHGVYAWVSPENRHAIARIVQRCLKPGGLLYVSYMSQPGAAALAGAQKLMSLLGRGGGSASTAGAQDGVRMLRELHRGGAGVFAAFPELGRQIDHMEREEPGYLAHEFLTQHWEPLHVADVMREFAAVGCDYVGSATPLENIDAVSVPGGVQALLRGQSDPLVAETIRDLARHQSLRRDIYQRRGGPDGPGGRLSLQAHRQGLLAQAAAALPGAPADGPLRFDTRIGPVDGPRELFGPALQALAVAAQTLGHLARHAAYAARPGALNQVFQMLFWAGCAHPLRTEPVDPRPAFALNRALLDTSMGMAGAGWLAAPVLGSALPVTATERAVAAALLREPGLAGAALVHAARDWERKSGRPWPAAGDAEVADIERRTLPRWRRYGVVPALPSGA